MVIEGNEVKHMDLGDRIMENAEYLLPKVVGVYDEKTKKTVPFDQCVERGFITQEEYDETVEFYRLKGLEFRDGRWKRIVRSSETVAGNPSAPDPVPDPAPL